MKPRPFLIITLYTQSSTMGPAGPLLIVELASGSVVRLEQQGTCVLSNSTDLSLGLLDTSYQFHLPQTTKVRSLIVSLNKLRAYANEQSMKMAPYTIDSHLIFTYLIPRIEF